jgi:murein DD-endopeptidase MepM/ murein hydrolase activator NlpD
MWRLALAFLVTLVVATPALGDDVGRKHQVDSKIASLQDRLKDQKQQEASLRSQVSGYTTRIRALEAQVGDVSLKLSTLEADLALHQKRLDALNHLFRVQSERLATLRAEYRHAIATLDRRLLEIYENGTPSTLELVLGARNLDDALRAVEYMKEIGAQDRHIAAEVAYSRGQVTAARKKTAKLRTTVGGETAVIRARTEQTQSVRDELVGSRDALAQTRSTKVVALSKLSASERAEAEEIDSLQAASQRIAAAIRAAQARDGSGPTQTASTAGLIWPVSGPVTSPFGWRWGRMHEGIDIGVPYGTPIRAAAAGTVIYCGWEEGYGNFVVIDHGGNLATAYGHQSSIAVTCGEQVDQGQTIGYVGCTGHCTGPHLHFEVRVDGNPVDPLGYLG